MGPGERSLGPDSSGPKLPESRSRSTPVGSGESLKIIEDHINRNYEDDTTIVEDWRKLQEVPSEKEIVSEGLRADEGHGLIPGEEPQLPENIVDSPWVSKEKYVSTHYQLLREDVVAPLRNAVASYRANPMMNDDDCVSIYTNVFVIGYTCSKIGMAARVQFSHERAGKRIRWSQSKRLQQGSIVALTTPSDKFKTICKIAVVASRSLMGVIKNPPEVDLFWGDPKEATFDSTEQYVMIEARDGYFEANRHMLVALQKLMFETFPLSKELVTLNKSIDSPKYVEGQPLRDLNSLSQTKIANPGDLIIEDINLKAIDILKEWPIIKGSRLDTSQTAALKRILTKKLAIIQGPPGTGKTFVSISALRVMLDNWSPGDSPIIVSAQTNHALDQLLTLIAPFEPNFVRLGSRTSKSNEIVRQRTLYEVRNKSQGKGRPFYGKYRQATRLLKDLGERVRNDIEIAVGQGDKEAKLLHDLGIISEAQYESLTDDQWIYTEQPELPTGSIPLWLGKDQILPVPRCPILSKGFDEVEDPDFEELDELEAEVAMKEDDYGDGADTLNGEYFSITEEFVGRRFYSGYTDKKIQNILDSTSNLWDIEQNVRGHIYRYFRRKLKEVQFDSFQVHWNEYERGTKIMKIARWEVDAALIKQSGIKLIGCTTTGLSKYRGLLAALKPRTLLVEEAAEALEGTVLAAAFESLEHLILVGDHKQLQANCNLRHLHKAPYNLGVSLFERLVRNGMEYIMLNEQRRMIPEIRMLLNPFYEDLKDHESVLDRVRNRKPVPGMGGIDSYFFHHDWPESRDDTASRLNIYEADMIVNFYNYLVVNGTSHSQITILTFYNGQRKLLLKLLKKRACFPPDGPFNVFTVDSYQGEENDVIILSLVRSNDEFKIGFLDNENRAVVSLSRARRGLYMFGNTINLLMANGKSNFVWGGVTDFLRTTGRFVFNGGLPLVCKNHNRRTVVQEPDDWLSITGGCDLKCEGKLGCGHPCPHQCHPFAHSDVLCKEPCPVRRPCGHTCIKRCGDNCECPCSTAPRREIPSQSVNQPGELHLDKPLNKNIKRSGSSQSVNQPGELHLDKPLNKNIKRSGSSQSVNQPGELHLDKSLNKNSKGSGAGLRGVRPKVPLQPPSKPSSQSLGSGPQKWREWDATRYDKALDDYRRSHQRTHQKGPTPGAITYKETHRRVAIKEGSRVPESASTRVIHIEPSVPARQECKMGILLDLDLPEGTDPTPNNIPRATNDQTSINRGAKGSDAALPGAAAYREPHRGPGQNSVPRVKYQARPPSPAESDIFTDIYGIDDDDDPPKSTQGPATAAPQVLPPQNSPQEDDLISFD